MFFTNRLKISIIALLFVSISNAQNFKVTLDAGHGGKDHGAMYHGFTEKDVNLAIVLKIGKLLDEKSGVTVNYTRDSDFFVDLVERADIANRIDANIFVSIHCNANKNTAAFGSETFVMGMSKNKSNLEAAKRENAVITLEKDYKKKYQGFDINKPETMIGLTMIQEEFEEQSIALAGKVQNKFKNSLNVKSRGVSQAPYMVLHKAYMPRVLIETGFISNEEEGARLNSEQGQIDIAEAVVAAIMDYKKDFFDSGSNEEIAPPKPKENQATPKNEDEKKNDKPNSKDLIYKIQLEVSKRKVETAAYNFKGLKNISRVLANSSYHYLYEDASDLNEAKSNLKKANDKGYKNAFIVGFKNNKIVKI